MLVVSETTANELLAPSGKTVMQVRDAVRARRSNTSTLDVGFGVDTNLQMSVPVTPVRQVMASNVVGLLRANWTDAARAFLIRGNHVRYRAGPNERVVAVGDDHASRPLSSGQ